MKEEIKRNKEIFKLHQKGLSYRQIAKLYDRDVAAIFRICKKLKVRGVDNFGVDKVS